MAFVHLRTHTEYSVVDGTLRVDDAAACGASADGQAGAGHHRPVQPVRRGQVLQGLPGQGCQADHRRRHLTSSPMQAHGSRRAPSGSAAWLLLVQNRQGYLNLSELLARGWVQNAQRAQAWITWEWLARTGRRADRPVGRRPGRGGPGPAGRRHRAGRCCGRNAPGRALFPGPLLHRAAARWPAAATSRMCAPPCRWPPRLGSAGGGHPPGGVCRARRLRRPRGPGVRGRGRDPGQPQAHQAVLAANSTSRPRRSWRRCLPTCPRRAGQHACAIAQRCNLTLAMGKNYLPDFPTPHRWRTARTRARPCPWRDYFRQASFDGLAAAAAAVLFPDASKRESPAGRPTSPGWSSRSTVILKMGFPGYFLIVADFINWAKNNGCPVGPGRGSGAGSAWWPMR